MDITKEECYNNRKGEERVPYNQLTFADDFIEISSRKLPPL